MCNMQANITITHISWQWTEREWSIFNICIAFYKHVLVVAKCKWAQLESDWQPKQILFSFLDDNLGE